MVLYAVSAGDMNGIITLKLHKGDAGPKVKKRLLKNLLQKALYPRCRSKKSPRSPPKSRNNFFEFFLEQEI